MGLQNIREFTHVHCRFRLRSGREVYGVIWEVDTPNEHRLHFASIGEYERARRDPRSTIDAVPMLPEEIMLAERLAC